MRALFHSVFGRKPQEALAVIFLRMGRTEVQAGADAHRLQLFHQRVAADAARGLIDADDKQMPGVLVIPGRDAQRFKRRVRQLAQVALGNLGPALIGVAQFSSWTSARAALISAGCT